MRIAFIALRGIPLSDGIVAYTVHLANFLGGQGHEVCVYTSRRYGNKDGNYGNFKIITVPSFKMKIFEKMSLTYFATKKAKRENYDIVHFHAMGPSIFAKMIKNRHSKIVIQSHGIEYERSKWGRFAKFVLRKLEKRTCNINAAFTVVSKALQMHFKKEYNKDTVYIPTAVSLPDLSTFEGEILRKNGLTKNGYFLFMARIVKEKGLHYLIKAYSALKTNKKLVVAGEINLKDKYHQEIINMSNNPNIIFVGNVSGLYKDTLLKGAYVFCQPSETEGLSVALLEAMSYQKCCLASDIPMNTEAMMSCGITFENKNCNDLADKMLYCINNENVISEKGKQARERIEKHFVWPVVGPQMLELYTKLNHE